MKKIILCLWECLAISAYGDVPSVEVKLALDKEDLFAGEVTGGTVSVTNIGQSNLLLPRPDRAAFEKLMELDNPQMGFAGGVSIISVEGETPLVPVKLGETVQTRINLFREGKDSSSQTVRMGFRVSPDRSPVWSNPVTIQLT